jgi:DNA-binding MurR/RpiR family transcriptional regulator
VSGLPQPLLGKIRFEYKHLSDKERLIANYILSHPNEMVHQTINEVSELLNVAEATVFRFCKRMGFKGFQQLKIALASETVSPIKQIHEEIAPDDPPKTIAEKVFHSNITALEDTLHILDAASFEQAVQMLLNARRVEFFGLGGSAVIAMDAFHKFIRTGIQAHATMDYHMQLLSASQLSKADVAVIISHSGTNKDTLQIMDTAKKAGAKTIGVTGYPKSPVGMKTDVALFTSSVETEYRSEALSSRISQLSLMDALYVNMMILNKERAKQSLAKVREAIAKTRL